MFKRFKLIKVVLFFAAVFFLGAGCAVTSSDNQSTISSILEGKNEIFFALTLSDLSNKGEGKMVFQFFSNSTFSGTPAFKVAVPLDLTDATGNLEKTYSFTDISMGKYYVRVFFDENDNNVLDANEMSGSYQSQGTVKKIKISEHNRQVVALNLN